MWMKRKVAKIFGCQSVGIIIRAVLRLFDKGSLTLADDFPIAHTIVGFDGFLRLENLLDELASLSLKHLLRFRFGGRLSLSRFLDLS